MPWYFRKSFKIAPGVRATLSKSGLSYSVGRRGMRVTTSRRGTYVTVGAGGVYYRQKLAGSTRSAGGVTPAVPVSAGGSFATAGVDQLVDASSAQTIQELNACLARPAYALWILILGFALALLLRGLAGWLFVLVGGATLIAAYLAHRSDVLRRTYPLAFQLDGVAAQQWQELQRAIGYLGQSSRLWRVSGASWTDDWKRNAGASRLISRHPVRVGLALPPGIATNVTPWCLDLGFQKLYFLPDRLYVWEQGRYGAVDYLALNVAHETRVFKESEGAPPDAEVVSYTWQYVNRDGSPDRRFSNNWQIPNCRYGYVGLESGTGLSLVFQASSLAAAEASAATLQRFLTARSTPRPPVAPAIHAWDCACRTRNAPQFPTCRRCQAPRSQGRPVMAPVPAAGSLTVPDAPVAIPVNSKLPWGWWFAACLYGFNCLLLLLLAVIGDGGSTPGSVPAVQTAPTFDPRPATYAPAPEATRELPAAPVTPPSQPPQREEWTPRNSGFSPRAVVPSGGSDPVEPSLSAAPPPLTSLPARRASRPPRQTGTPVPPPVIVGGGVVTGTPAPPLSPQRGADPIGEPIAGLPPVLLPCGHQLLSTATEGLGGTEVGACVHGHQFQRTATGWIRR